MWIAFYNQAVGDVLMLTSGNSQGSLKVESKDNVTFIYDKQSDQLVAINIFGVKDALNLTVDGPQSLTDQQVSWVQQALNQVGFDETLDFINPSEKLVVGYVEECQPHQDSDHLSVTKTCVGEETLQIVCGAKNIRQGLTVLVAQPGSVMPNGSIIWPGELRGVESHGMICSTRELGLTDIEDKPGIWELEDKFRPGTLLTEVVQELRA